ncbi:MAG TPA: hypothetical protein VHP14_09055 [Anaerolineales bacterium]|nr:hypothetical protein [Anaerolineales bacterium]
MPFCQVHLVHVPQIDHFTDLVWASPKPVISLHMSVGAHPPSPACAIIFFITPAIICDIILGRALVTNATKTPPTIAPPTAANATVWRYLFLSTI